MLIFFSLNRENPNIVKVIFQENSKCESLGDYAFQSCTALSKINIPNSVKNIGIHVFYDCPGIATAGPATGDYNLTFEWKTEIPRYAFEGCNYLSDITIPESICEIGEYAFWGCAELKSAKISEDSVVAVGDYAFNGCSSLTGILLTGDIGEYAFENCKSLKKIELLNTVNKIGGNAFARCSNLASIGTLKDGITIGDGAFYDCDSLTDISIPKNSDIGDLAFGNCNALTSVVLPEGLKHIGWWFESCTALPSIKIPESVQRIADNAFKNCSGLKSIEIPKLVESIGLNAFANCVNVESIYFNAEDAYVVCRDYGHSFGYVGLETNGVSVVIGSDVKKVPAYLFGMYNRNPVYISGSCKVTELTFSDNSNCEEIGYLAFAGCTSLKKVEIPEKIIKISMDAFQDCVAIEEIWFNATNLKEGWIAGGNSEKGIELYVGANVKKLNYINSCISEIQFDEGSQLETIGSRAFAGYKKLFEIELPESVNEIGERAFESCNGLNKVILSKGIERIERYTFKDCANLKEITIPANVSAVELGDDSAFSGCNSLTEINVDESNAAYMSDGGILYNKAKTKLLYCPQNKQDNVRIPSGVLNIEEYAFYKCGALNYVIIPGSIKRIASSAFYQCSKLTDVYYADKKTQWYEIDIGAYNEPLTNADVHYESTGPGTGYLDVGLVLYFSKWIPGTKTAYFGSLSEVEGTVQYLATEKTDMSFEDDVENLLNSYVLVESIPSKGVFFAYDLISIKPVETKIGTVTDKSSNAIGIDGVNYPIYEDDLLMAVIGIGDSVRYHLHEGELVGIDILQTVTEVVLIEEVSVVCYVNKNPANEPTETFILSPNITATVGAETYNTDSTGQVAVRGQREDVVTFGQEGYISRSYTLQELSNNNTVYLQKESDAPVIYGLWMGDTNILQKEAVVEFDTEYSFELVPEIYWGASPVGKILLSQGEKILELKDGSNSVQVAKYFDIENDIILTAQNSIGKTTAKKLKIRSSAQSAFDGFCFEWGDKVEVVLPDAAGFLAGTKITMDLYSHVPVEVVIEGDKFYASLGYQIDEKLDDKSGVFEGEIKNAVKQARKMVELANTIKANDGDMKKLWGELKNISQNWVPVEGSLAVQGGASFVGFAEGYVTEDGLVFTNSGGVLLFGGNVTYTKPFVIPAFPTVPLYFELKFSGETEAQFNLFIEN